MGSEQWDYVLESVQTEVPGDGNSVSGSGGGEGASFSSDSGHLSQWNINAHGRMHFNVSSDLQPSA